MGYHWHGGYHDGWAWVVPGVMMLLLGLLLVALLVLVWRTLSRGGPSGPPQWGSGPTRSAGPTAGAEQILSERLARGEIDVEEYRLRLAALREGAGPPS